ncbi:putative Hsp70 family chaperone [Seiridium cardinale]
MDTLTPSAVVKRKARRLIFRGKKYYLCTFDVKSIIGPADLRFELWFAGQRFSRNHDPLKITWDSEGEKVGGQRFRCVTDFDVRGGMFSLYLWRSPCDVG